MRRKKRCFACSVKLTVSNSNEKHRMLGKRICNWCGRMWVHDCC